MEREQTTCLPAPIYKEMFLSPAFTDSDDALFEAYFGTKREEIEKIFLSGNQQQREALMEALDNRFYTKFKARNRIKIRAEAEMRYEQLVQQANSIPQYITACCLPGPDCNPEGLGKSIQSETDYTKLLDPRNDVLFMGNSPAEILALHYDSLAQNDVITAYEAKRLLLLTSLLEPFQSESIDQDLKGLLNKIQRYVTTNVFTSFPNSDGLFVGYQSYTIVQDRIDQSFSGLYDPQKRYDNRYHRLVQTTQPVRYAHKIGNVYIFPREKRPATAVLKAITKAKDRAPINPHDVEDRLGIMFAVLGDPNINTDTKNQRDELAGNVFSALMKKFEDRISIEQDDNLGQRSSSDKIDWLRYQVKILGGHPLHRLELIYFDRKGFFDYYYRTGRKGNGAVGHPLYEIDRVVGAFPLLFPQDIYWNFYQTFNVEGLIRERRDQVLRRLTS
ncbi:hypothetical protein KC726_03470 [Candidatus Woesebacteria bacterium]|nr:hypothetical protein [Candidatus Woesebacteria bacterium]